MSYKMLPISVLFGVLAIWCMEVASGLNLNNECKKTSDYALVALNPFCWYNPDVTSSTEDIANRHGYKFETHYVKTDDGYTLTLFRVPSRLNDTSNTTKQPFILCHGILGDGRNWFLRGDDSPALRYADNYDVWVVNARGSDDSSNENYTKSDKGFWQYSFEEIGLYDIPAVTEYVANKTNQKGNILYAGHSMGTTAGLVYCSLLNEHCMEHLKGLILLAPVAMLNQTKVPGLREIAALGEEIKAILELLHIYRVGRNIAKLCPVYPMNNICILVLQLATGYSNENIYPQILPILSVKGGAPVTVLILAHYAQIIKNEGEFARLDRGSQKNLALYGSSTPPLYPLENVQLPTHLICANNDAIATVSDAEDLYEALPGDKSITIIPDVAKVTLGHMDFIVGKNMTHIYAPIDAAIEKINAK